MVEIDNATVLVEQLDQEADRIAKTNVPNAAVAAVNHEGLASSDWVAYKFPCSSPGRRNR
jgi:hypothetical protein